MVRQVLLFIIILILSSILFASNIYAVYDPRTRQNNKFGIHIIDENDIEDASNLVNSSGGDWGYVTLVITKTDRNKEKWQNTFDKLRAKHLIPILRIATREENGYWEKGSLGEIDGWVDFLDSLNWVIENRYVTIGNEPNHAKEWGGEINPQEFSDYYFSFSKKLKQKNKDFFILNPGFDSSATDSGQSISIKNYLRKMIESNSEIFKYTDGWTSHSYPNPNFSGSTNDSGLGTIISYEYELDYLKNELKINKDFPIFITETGWVHNYTKSSNREIENISINLKTAFEKIWVSNNIVAITPFLLNYLEPPFDKFSWKKNGVFFDFYYQVQSLLKIKGNPRIINSADIKVSLLPLIFRDKDQVYGVSYAKNTGQAIWLKGISQEILSEKDKYFINLIYPETVFPNHSGMVNIIKIIN